jgi:hypothetical protein
VLAADAIRRPKVGHGRLDLTWLHTLTRRGQGGGRASAGGEKGEPGARTAVRSG